MEIDHIVKGCDQSRRDRLRLQEELSDQNRALRETHFRNLRDIEELQKNHVLKVEEHSRRKLTEDQNTIMELRATIQELQNEVNCMNDSRDFKDAESVRSGQSHVTSQAAFFPTVTRSWRNAKPFPGNAEPQRWGRQVFGTHMVYREKFLQIQRRLLQHLIQEKSILGFVT